MPEMELILSDLPAGRHEIRDPRPLGRGSLLFMGDK